MPHRSKMNFSNFTYAEKKMVVTDPAFLLCLENLQDALEDGRGVSVALGRMSDTLTALSYDIGASQEQNDIDLNGLLLRRRAIPEKKARGRKAIPTIPDDNFYEGDFISSAPRRGRAKADSNPLGIMRASR